MFASQCPQQEHRQEDEVGEELEDQLHFGPPDRAKGKCPVVAAMSDRCLSSPGLVRRANTSEFLSIEYPDLVPARLDGDF